MKTPITLLIDDPCPLIHVYREHWRDVHHEEPVTKDGRPLLEVIPNDFLDRFCDIMERRRIRGKFSVVPAPAGKGDIVRGIEGFPVEMTRAWIETMKRRLSPLCDFCPEGITHNLAVDLQRGGYFPESESEWSQRQTRETLTPYLVRELELMRYAGIPVTGITSPWVFGIESEPEYIAAIVEAQERVNGLTFSWYFLHMEYERPETRPWVAHDDGARTLISIPGNIDDFFWRTINSPSTDTEWVSSVADNMLTEDGRSGKILTVLEAGGWPVIVTHWQSLFSNGLETGLAALDELGRRVDKHLSGRVQWMTCSELARKTVDSLV